MTKKHLGVCLIPAKFATYRVPFGVAIRAIEPTIFQCSGFVDEESATARESCDKPVPTRRCRDGRARLVINERLRDSPPTSTRRF